MKPPVTNASELPLTRSGTVGDFRIHLLEGGLQWLDGGAMFGVVPKPLWEKRLAADERNRIPLALRGVLVETPDELVVIETGLGNKESEKFHKIYGVDNEVPEGAAGHDRLQAAILDLGFALEDVTTVINTHLHFDHAGGNTWMDEEGQVHLTFPNARYLVQRGEWEYAHSANERTRASYLPHNYQPIADQGRWDLLEGPQEVRPGISVAPTPGHTPHHQSVVIRSGDQAACFLADVIPTMNHLPLPWIMGYDVEPLVTLESKRELLYRASREDWLLISTHDAIEPWGRIHFDGATVEFERYAGD